MHTSVTTVASDSTMTARSVATTFKVMCTSLSQLCEHRCQSAVSCHHYQNSVPVYSNDRSLSFSSLLSLFQFISLSQCYLGHCSVSQHSEVHCCHNTTTDVTLLAIVTAVTVWTAV